MQKGMADMFNGIRKEHKVIFAVGAVVGAAIITFIKTKKAHDIAVKGLAQGMMVKDSLLEEVSNIREEADDICNEAKIVAKANCENTEA